MGVLSEFLSQFLEPATFQADHGLMQLGSRTRGVKPMETAVDDATRPLAAPPGRTGGAKRNGASPSSRTSFQDSSTEGTSTEGTSTEGTSTEGEGTSTEETSANPDDNNAEDDDTAS
mmetsp:Transcript_27718/g.69923  ORF Transcript_27718/g.69923 Transcript_27718/m.69923 type:complete len:117 (-) Transcript_27718:696-1046(-)|eukprot:CAMPEP_0178989622 /NCGR_PEP_ID=MMETSP0795-20121207/4482_1 /TAXON_ID=88552 /ORGANISM="Amoebophrya sp., Strain Ameob2" /LENGTH=116 /DNA_ID=CAMNT_0020681055 /DNA_START=157 /DNA_END=507 /DNA_ORIENTATION=+